RKELQLPDIRDHAFSIDVRGASQVHSTEILGRYLRDVMRLNAEANNFRIFGPDETESNLLGAVFDLLHTNAVSLLEDG
ncbi:hypothetical protein ACCS64_40010, partial [Rhizobium ruizarguesonis]